MENREAEYDEDREGASLSDSRLGDIEGIEGFERRVWRWHAVGWNLKRLLIKGTTHDFFSGRVDR